jgi:hypothetical protein
MKNLAIELEQSKKSQRSMPTVRRFAFYTCTSCRSRAAAYRRFGRDVFRFWPILVPPRVSDWVLSTSKYLQDGSHAQKHEEGCSCSSHPLTQLCIASQVIEHCVDCSAVLVLLWIDVVNLASNSDTKDRPENSSYVSYVLFRVPKMDYSLLEVQ